MHQCNFDSGFKLTVRIAYGCVTTVVTWMAFPVCRHFDKKTGVQCKHKSRGATGHCSRHGGAICTYPGCKKSARFAGCRCALHVITKPKPAKTYAQS